MRRASVSAASRKSRAVILFTGDPRAEAERKFLPARFLTALHQELVSTIGSVDRADLLVASDRDGVFGIDSNRGSMQRRCTDLGDRVQTSIEYAKKLGYEDALVVAGDIVGVGTFVFDAAFAALEIENAECVIAPSSDGGFSILGVRTDIKLDWSLIPWCTRDAASGLRRSAEQSGVTIVEIEPLDDIDSLADALRAVKRLTTQTRLKALLLGLLQDTPLPDLSPSLDEIHRTTVTPHLRAPPLRQVA